MARKLSYRSNQNIEEKEKAIDPQMEIKLFYQQGADARQLLKQEEQMHDSF